jgi:F-type H+-transporting ATPase subunit delta
MGIEKDIIARKYATAFMKVNGDHLTSGELSSFKDFGAFVHAHPLFLVTLDMPSIPHSFKLDAIKQIIAEQKVCSCITKLLYLLLHHNRIKLLDTVISEIRALYKRTQNIQKFIVASSHSLSEEEQKKIDSFIAQNIDATTTTQFVVDKNLICGLKMKSINLLWERSIAKKLRDVKKSMLGQGSIC